MTSWQLFLEILSQYLDFKTVSLAPGADAFLPCIDSSVVFPYDVDMMGGVYGYHHDWPLDNSARYGQTLPTRILGSTDSVLGGAYT